MTMHDFSPDDPLLDDPFEIDTSVAHPARRYNYWLGGKDNFEADRISGDAGAAIFPTAKIAVMENRRFLRRAVTFLVKEAGIRQFLDIGTGIPSADNVHEVAQSIAPEARVVYVDNDPIVLAHARRLLSRGGAGATSYLHADLREPDAILTNPILHKTIDLGQPVALMVVAVMHFIEDGDDPYGHVAKLVAALPPGSYLAMSHGTRDFMSEETRANFDTWTKREKDRNRDPARPRSRDEFARFFEGMELVPPGIVALPDWRSETPPADRPSAADTAFYAAVARIS
ncbi:MAG TPA: SAM-dependent methyltransferase [Streptosporangiaceae bacterium]|nr:SAM-dependent methyltransferase [Streptosporangiaceae bacterium]